jgi:serine O-acetyltransferase
MLLLYGYTMRLINYIRGWLKVPHRRLLTWLESEYCIDHTLVGADIVGWLSTYGAAEWARDAAARGRANGLQELIWRRPGFRALFNYRLAHGSARPSRLARVSLLVHNKLLPGPPSLFLVPGKVGANLYLVHGAFSSVIAAQSIGADCLVHQNVTIGWRTSEETGAPVIGDRVTIYTGAVVVGSIVVGDGSVIAANAVVTHDVPPDTVVGGVPARVLRASTVQR